MDVRQYGYMPAASNSCRGVGDTPSIAAVHWFFPSSCHGITVWRRPPANPAGLVLHSSDPPPTEEKHLGTEVSGEPASGKREQRRS